MNKITFALLFSNFQIFADATNLRRNSLGGFLNSRKPQTKACTVLAFSDLPVRDLEGDPLHSGKDDQFECEMDPEDANGHYGLSFPIQATQAQNQMMISMLQSGDLVSGYSTLLLPGSEIGTGGFEEGVFLPSGHEISLGKKNSHAQGHRHLAVVTGNKPILAVKVNAPDKIVAATPEEISDDIFGTYGDPVNMKSQFFACSFGKLNIAAGISNEHELEPGVMEVTITVNLVGNSRATIRNAITTAVQAKLGFSLPGPYEQVMYIVEGCYEDCGWAAYAYVNSWNSVFQGQYYKFSGVQMHELGHNFNLAHSGGLDGKTYTDHTCLMGNPLYNDDVGKMCYNPAKNFQIGWYDDGNGKNVITHNPMDVSVWTGIIIGIADYTKNTLDCPVVIKIETGINTHQFIGFNRATGVNLENDEADNAVTMIETGNSGESYSQSYLKTTLTTNGSSYTYANWAGTNDDLVLTMHSRDLDPASGMAATANITIELVSHVTPAPSAAPSAAPSMPAPSAAPSTPAPSAAPSMPAPSAAPSMPAAPSAAPSAVPSMPAPSAAPSTPAPSAAPSTPAPSAAPSTPPPSAAPSDAPTPTSCTKKALVGETCKNKNDCCSGICNQESRNNKVCM